MALWNLSYDFVACFLLLMVIVWYYSEKKIPVKSHKAFMELISIVFVANGFEIIMSIMARYPDEFSLNLLKTIMQIQIFAMNLIPLAFANYILLLTHVNNKRKRYRWMFGVSFLFLVLVTVLNPVFDWAIGIEDGYPVVFGMGYLVYAMDAVMILFSIIVMIFNRREMAFARMLSLSLDIVLGVIAWFLQVSYKLPLINLALSVMVLTLYYYLQNPNSVTDPVTKQFNRKFMGEHIRSTFETEKRFGIIMVALDDFKFINKTYGVENGDNLLRQVGTFLEKLHIPKAVFRYGSDQFCIEIIKNVDDVRDIADLIQDRFRHPWYSKSAVGIMMSATVCCIECPRDARNYGGLIEVIDYSMSVAKKTKKGGITNSADVELDKLRNDKAVEKAVRLAIDRGEIMVYYQPIYSVSKGAYSSAEALVRINDEELGWISPEVFIPLAEKNGMILEMGNIIFEKVCRFIRDFKLEQTSVEYIEVNISPVQLIQTDFVDGIIATMEKYDVKPSQINMEITETATMGSAAIVHENIQKLVDYGIRFSLDDYGSGNANIDYINHMPFSIIKLDKYIVWDAFDNKKAGITLEYTIGMLNALELSIVAEGVETEEMRDKLTQIGCHYMQGWYYSKAISDLEFMKLLEE
ncbi:MAG: putative bifunctional diguanylate cyclase/phosphodiesterase [Wujia sp.]